MKKAGYKIVYIILYDLKYVKKKKKKARKEMLIIGISEQ